MTHVAQTTERYGSYLVSSIETPVLQKYPILEKSSASSIGFSERWDLRTLTNSTVGFINFGPIPFRVKMMNLAKVATVPVRYFEREDQLD